ncbi:hypothetical protein ACLOJK_024351, partial [Asimina triloba]
MLSKSSSHDAATNDPIVEQVLEHVAAIDAGMSRVPASPSVSESTQAAEFDAMLERVQPRGEDSSDSPTETIPPMPKRKKAVVRKIRAGGGEIVAEPLITEATVHVEVSIKRRAPKKKTTLHDLNYESWFGGAVDYFDWAPATAPMEFLHSSHEKTRHRPMRTYRMKDIEGRSTPFLVALD